MTSLVKKIDERLEAAAGKTARPLGVYILFDSTANGLDEQLREIAKKEALKRVFLSIGAPPKNYEVASEADVTVVIYNIGRRSQQQVTANFGLRKGELDECEAEAIIKAISDMLPK